jgi:hypothetical protein
VTRAIGVFRSDMQIGVRITLLELDDDAFNRQRLGCIEVRSEAVVSVGWLCADEAGHEYRTDVFHATIHTPHRRFSVRATTSLA